jgi:hypothetical protein
MPRPPTIAEVWLRTQATTALPACPRAALWFSPHAPSPPGPRRHLHPGRALPVLRLGCAVLASEPERFTKWFRDPKFPGCKWSVLQEQAFENAWHHFTEDSKL